MYTVGGVTMYVCYVAACVCWWFSPTYVGGSHVFEIVLPEG
jgi:hypothetical protein